MVNPMLTVTKRRGRLPLSMTSLSESSHQKSYARYITKLDSKRARIESKKSTKVKGYSQGWDSDDLKRDLRMNDDSETRHIPSIYAEPRARQPPKKDLHLRRQQEGTGNSVPAL